MTTHTKQPYTQPFVALELALTLITRLRPIVAKVRRHSPKLARQIEDAASSAVANLGEGNRRRGGDRLHFFRIAEGSTDETRCHLRVALAWGWVTVAEIDTAMQLADRELAMLYKLTH